MKKVLTFSSISLSYRAPESKAIDEAMERAKKSGLRVDGYAFSISKKAVDARKKQDLRIVYSVSVTPKGENGFPSIPAKKLETYHAAFQEQQPLTIKKGHEKALRPLVVGMGPAGLFAALSLAENGYRPIIIDRGEDVQNRINAVNKFHRDGVLDPDSNVQFGAGGAGTFSDGKLMTRIKDPYCAYVFERLFEFGAPEDILVQAHAHVGTDILRTTVSRMLSRIEELGGTLMYRCTLLGLQERADGSVTANTTCCELQVGAVILAIGNGARDTYLHFIAQNYEIVPKPISIGARIEHLRSDIESAIYGQAAGHPALGAAEYHLSDTTGDRGVYTFCMCPGGEVVAAASEEGRLVTNGMSYHARNGRNSNAAIAVSVNPEDVESQDGSKAAGMIAFQRMIEHRAFVAGGNQWKAPVQTVGDLLNGKWGTTPSRVMPSYRNGLFTVANFDQIFPQYVLDGLSRGIRKFDRAINGFANEDAILTAPETRTSAPVRIVRNEDRTAIGHSHLYPCGEGAGYAGGITSAAVDGLRTAIAFMERYAPVEN